MKLLLSKDYIYQITDAIFADNKDRLYRQYYKSADAYDQFRQALDNDPRIGKDYKTLSIAYGYMDGLVMRGWMPKDAYYEWREICWQEAREAREYYRQERYDSRRF